MAHAFHMASRYRRFEGSEFAAGQIECMTQRWRDGMIRDCERMLRSEHLARASQVAIPIIQRRRPQIRALVPDC